MRLIKDLEILKYGGTQYTVSYDLRNLKAYFHTSENPNLRSFNVKTFDFDAISKPLNRPLRDEKLPFSIDVTPDV